MKVYWKYYCIPFIYGIIFSWKGNIHENKKVDVFEIAAYLGNGYVTQCNLESALEIISTNFIYYMFIIVFSTYIYRHFCNSSVYVFSRCENRMKWYSRECLKLFWFTFMGNVVVLAGFLVTALLGCGITSSRESIWCVFVYLGIYTLWIYASVLLANVISILQNSVVGNLTVMGMLIFLVILLGRIHFDTYTSSDFIRMRSNPMSYTILNWYRLKKNGRLSLGTTEYACNPWMGIIVLSICCVLVFLIGAIVIQKKEIMDNNTDN